MKERIINLGAIMLFYLLLVVGVLLLNMRFSYLNMLNSENINDTYVAMNK